MKKVLYDVLCMKIFPYNYVLIMCMSCEGGAHSLISSIDNHLGCDFVSPCLGHML